MTGDLKDAVILSSTSKLMFVVTKVPILDVFINIGHNLANKAYVVGLGDVEGS